MLLAHIIQREYKKHRYANCKRLIVVSVIALSLFAALRDVSVGTDVTVYLTSNFHVASRYEYLDYISRYRIEPGYYTFVWIIQRLFHNIHAFFFFHQLFIASVIYYVGWKYIKTEGVFFPLYIYMYLIMWYGVTFNIIRQTIGITIVFLAFDLLKKGKWIPYIGSIAVASLFHTSLWVALLLPLLKWISYKRYNLLYTWSMCIGGILIIRFIQPVFNLVNIIGTFDRYNRFFGSENTNFNRYYFLIKIIIFAGIFVFAYKFRKSKIDNDIVLLINISVVDLMGYCMSLIIRYGYRISYPFMIYNILLVPCVDKAISNRKSKYTYRLFITLSMMVYWYYRYVKIGYDGIYPYTFMLR